MSQATVQKLESELEAEFNEAPAGLAAGTRLVFHKKPAAFNALTHGLSGQNIILTAEELPHYAQMGLEYMRELEPVGARETGNAQLIFQARWRLHRILCAENNMLSGPRRSTYETHHDTVERVASPMPGLNLVDAFVEHSHDVDIVGRYETRLIRNTERLSNELERMQDKRAHKKMVVIFDEDSSPAIVWYNKLLARAEALLKARQDYEDSLDPAAKRRNEPEPNAPLTHAASAGSSEGSFGKITPEASAGTPQANPSHPHKTRNSHGSSPKNWRNAA